MQIDLYKLPTKKDILKCLGWPILFIVLWFNGCSNNAVTTTKVVVPAVVAKFESKKPTSKPIEIIQKPITEIKKDGVVIRSEVIENPLIETLKKENEKLKYEYSKMSDSLQHKAYSKAIELNTFQSKFEDKYLKLTIDGVVRGEVQEVTPSYEIKEREADAIIKETYLRVFIGASLGINKELDRGLYKFDIDFQNKRGDIFSAEYMRVNSQNFGIIGIKKSILNFKR